MAFPTTLTNAVDGVTEIIAAHLNSLEAKVGIDGSAVVTSLDYLLKNAASHDPGHLHTHANLLLKNADDHTQYALLAGRAGGQTLIGGTAAGQNLTLQSTAHATKGKILFGTSAYDEVNNRLGIGTTGPACTLEVLSASYPVIRTVRSLTDTNTTNTALVIQKRTTADMVDGFGSVLEFEIRDSAGVDNLIAGMSAVRDGADNTGRLDMRTYLAGSIVTVMSLKSNGNVGIGTTGPGAPLEVYKAGAGADNTGGGIIIARGPGPASYRGGAIYSRYFSGAAADALVFGVTTDNNKNPYSDLDQIRMVVLSNGNVGIGTSSFGTSAAKVLALASGTAPTTAPADLVQLWCVDVNGAAGYAGLHKRTETTNLVEVVPGVVIKTDTGDSANPYEGLMQINTFDNTFKVYADAGWRQLATW
jgi:hypothetical protein